MACTCSVHARVCSNGGLSRELRNTDFSWLLVVAAGLSKPLFIIVTTVVLLPAFGIKGFASFKWLLPSTFTNP